VIRQFAGGGEPAFRRMLPWAADLERSGDEVAELPDGFWLGPGRRRIGTGRARGTGRRVAERVAPGLTGRIA